MFVQGCLTPSQLGEQPPTFLVPPVLPFASLAPPFRHFFPLTPARFQYPVRNDLYCVEWGVKLYSLTPLHLTTSKVMVIVWRLRGNIIRTVLYIANVLHLQWAQLTNTVHTAQLGLELYFYVFWVELFIFIFVYVSFYLRQLSHFTSCFVAGVTNLNEPPSSFLLPPHYCGLGAGFIPFRAIVNNKQCETLVIHY